MSQVNYTDLLIESILEESAKTDFRDKFGEDTLKKFDAAKQRFLNNKLSTDYGQYLKYSKEDLLQLIADQYDKEKDATKIRNIKGDTAIRGEYKDLGIHGKWHVYQPLDYIASMDLGVNTGWCTTGRYRHAGHPDYTPSEKDAQEHFDKYTKDYKIKLYYFLNPDTMYGEYAIALYPRTLDISHQEEHIYYTKDKQTYRVNELNFEMFDYKDEQVFAAEVVDAARQMNIPVVINGDAINAVDNCIIKYSMVIDVMDKKVSTIKIPDGITSIGAEAFRDCKNLTDIIIPNSVKTIGVGAFYHCTSLTGITIPSDVTSIGNSAFAHCRSLTSIIIPDGVTTIGYYTFADCSSLTSITLPNSVREIFANAFAYCDKLTIYCDFDPADKALPDNWSHDCKEVVINKK